MRAGAFNVGDKIDDKYEVLEQIGSGGFGTVLRVKQLEDGQHLAMKYCITGIGSDDFKRFDREVSTLESIYLDNVIRILDSELNGVVPYYIMPLAEASLVETAPTLRASEIDLLTAFKQICNGVKKLHERKCIHRDIKPSNILIVDGIPHVADFGLAKVLTATTMGLTTSFIGTYEYAAPEQYDPQEAKNADSRSDIFSLGKLLYWLYTGRSPSHMDLTHLPNNVRPIIERCVRTDKEARYQTVSSLLDVIELYEKSLASPSTKLIPDVRTPKSLREQISQTIHSISNSRPDSGAKIRRFMAAFSREIATLTPDFKDKTIEPDELLIKAIDDSVSLVTDFCYVADHVSQMNSLEDAEALFQSFEGLLKGYDLPEGFSGSFNDYFFDFSKFICHELFVSFVALLIRDERWDNLAAILENVLCLDGNIRENDKVVDFKYINKYIALLNHRNGRLQMGRLSPHADILHQRHSDGELSGLVPSPLLSDADYFLYLRSISDQHDSEHIKLHKSWFPTSILYMSRGGPKYLRYAKSKKYASKILRPLSLASVEDLRKLVKSHGRAVESAFSHGMWTSSLATFDTSTIGSL